MPVYLIPDFCRIVGIDLEHLILGKARERVRQVLAARKVATIDADILERYGALANTHQQLAKAVAETNYSQSSRNRKKSTQGK